MARKSKRVTGVSGNPARRAQQEAHSRTRQVPPQLPEDDYGLHLPVAGPDSTDVLVYDEVAHTVLTGRGWQLFDMPDFAHVDRWHWGPSGDDEATYWTAESFCESTAVESDENGLKVEFASYTDPTTALYATLGDLMADLELIESYRAGQPLPALPHAATVTPAP